VSWTFRCVVPSLVAMRTVTTLGTSSPSDEAAHPERTVDVLLRHPCVSSIGLVLIDVLTWQWSGTRAVFVAVVVGWCGEVIVSGVGGDEEARGTHLRVLQ
jgi:hypothetical protein